MARIPGRRPRLMLAAAVCLLAIAILHPISVLCFGADGHTAIEPWGGEHHAPSSLTQGAVTFCLADPGAPADPRRLPQGPCVDVEIAPGVVTQDSVIPLAEVSDLAWLLLSAGSVPPALHGIHGSPGPYAGVGLSVMPPLVALRTVVLRT